MKFKRMFAAGILVFSMTLNSLAVYATEIIRPVQAVDTTEVAGKYLRELMEFIIDSYAGESVNSQMLYEAAARGMVDPLDDFTEYLTAKGYSDLYDRVTGNYKGIGIQFSTRLDGSIEVYKVFPNTPSSKAGILIGDVVMKANGTPVSGYAEKGLSEIIAGVDGAVQLEIKRGSEVKNVTMEKAEIHMPTVEHGYLGDYLPEARNDKTLGYIKMSQVGERTADEMAEAISQFKNFDITGVVIDLRGNPGGIKDVIEDISKMLVPSGAIYSTVDSKGAKVTYNSELQSPPFRKVAILVDSDTASAAELFASAMQDAKAATIIGRTTYGKGVIQSFVSLATGDTLKYTSYEYLRRNGGKLDKIGIKPDIEISKPKHLDKEIFTINNDGTGAGIENLKSILSYMGYKIEDKTNLYDDATKAIVAAIQKGAGLKQTGQMDIQTATAINTAFNIFSAANDLEMKKAFEILQKM